MAKEGEERGRGGGESKTHSCFELHTKNIILLLCMYLV